ncbi:hypothetical protein ABZP36_015463 [Zizania latifolia]
MGAGIAEDDGPSYFEKRHPRLHCTLMMVLVVVGFLPLMHTLWNSIYGYQEQPEFWVKVPGVEGLERGPGAAAAPVFNVTLRVNNKATNRPFCAGRVSAAVAYAGVQLARAELPNGFCVPGLAVSSVPMSATSDGLGIPSELYERMASQRRRHARVSLEVQVRLDDCGLCGPPPVMLWCTAVLHGRPKGPFLCTFAYMLKDGEPLPQTDFVYSS